MQANPPYFRQSLVRLGLLVVCAIWAFATCYPFVNTGKPLERSFHPWERKKPAREPHWYGRGDGSIDDLLWISRSGDTYITVKTRPRRLDERYFVGDPAPDKPWDAEHAPPEVYELTILDTLTNQVVGQLGPFIDCPGNFLLSRDRRLLTFHMSTVAEVLLYDLVEGKKIRSFLTRDNPLEFSANGSMVLIQRSGPVREIVLLDLATDREVAKFSRGNERLSAFFDASERPCVTVVPKDGGPVELWELTGPRRVGELPVAVEQEIRNMRDDYQVSADKTAYYCCRYSPLELIARVCSLPDGKALGQLHKKAYMGNFALSADGRYALHSATYRNEAAWKLIRRWPDLDLDRWLPEEVKDPKESRLYDLSQGTCWPGLPDSKKATFVQGADRLIIFNNHGRYDFDVPPRWQYFTPWAWPALAGWLTLITVWWKLRKLPNTLASAR